MFEKKKLREGPIISDQPRPPLRGLSFPQNDIRPGLPKPGPRTDVTWTRPTPTTAPDTGFKLNPENPTAGSLTRNPPFPYARPGNSPTATLGFKKNSPSGTGLVDQPEPRRPRKTTQ